MAGVVSRDAVRSGKFWQAGFGRVSFGMLWYGLAGTVRQVWLSSVMVSFGRWGKFGSVEVCLDVIWWGRTL